MVIALAFACSDGPTNPGELGTIEELVEFERPGDAECGAELEALYDATDAAESLSVRDERGLLNKVARAAQKINQGKFQDAVDKLADYDQKLSELEATIGTGKEKISQTDANVLRPLLTDAQACVANLLSGP